MPEIWDYLARARRQKALCASDVDAIKESCSQNHGHRHVIECPECYAKVLQRMHSRYSSSPDAECFAGQASFPKDVAELFAQARERRSALREIEERATKGRHARIVQTVKESQVIKHLLRDSGQMHLLPKMESGSSVLGAVLGEIRNSLGHVPAPSEDVDHSLAQLTDAEALSPDETLQVIHQIFFSDYKNIFATGSEAELERLRKGSSLDVIMEHRLERSLASKAAKDVKERHRRRLDELRRAQTAHEIQKNKKTKHRHAIGPPQTPTPSLEVPPCATCHSAADSKSFISCPLCQLQADLDERQKLTVYCSSACYHDAFDSHLSDAHVCTAADDCVQLRVEDGAMDCDGSLVFCSECLRSLKTLTPYCSKQCAEANLQPHTESVHRRQGEKANGGLEHSNGPPGNDGESRNHGSNGIHLTDLHDAMLDLEKRTSLAIIPVE